MIAQDTTPPTMTITSDQGQSIITISQKESNKGGGGDMHYQTFTPEENIPNWHDLGDFNIEYVQIKDKKNQIVYQDNDFLDDIKKVEDSKKF